MKFCLAIALFTAACAGTTMQPAQRLPSVDRIAHQVRARLGDEAVASIALCVAANGKVSKVSLLEGTAYEPFDAAIVRDAHEWQFASMPGATAATKLQTCERAKVKYLAPR
jgi:hypothetical protein